MVLKNKAEFEECLHEASELERRLEKVLGRSLTELHIDPNQYIREYNNLLRTSLRLHENELVEDIFCEMSSYEFTGDDRTDVVNTKQRLVEVYLRSAQLVAYLETALELG
ncbi:MAG: hypothetical protein LUP95_06630 [Euryarchaeota archaeon]|nr:hypothetical protein [Euryarchaeota archaeon]